MTTKTKLFVALLWVLIPILAITSAADKSATCDEPNHLYRGYAYWETGRLAGHGDDWGSRINEQLAALSVRLFYRPEHFPPLEPGGNLNRVAAAFITHNDPQTILFWARLPFVAMSMVMAAFLFVFVKRFYGIRSALLALFLYTFSPNLMAHARLAVADFTGAVTLFVATVCFVAYLKKPGLRRLIACGVSLAAAMLSKESAILLVGLFPGMMVLNRFLQERPWRQLTGAAVRGVGAFCVIALVCFLTVWGAYRFEVGPFLPEGREHGTLKRMKLFAPLKGVMSDSQIDQLYAEANRWLETTPVPAPSFLRVMKRKLLHSSHWGQSGYLMGEHSATGWRHYFPVAFAVKVPLAITLLFLVGLTTIAVRRSPRRRLELLLLIPPAVLFAAAMTSSLNIGFRHVLGVMPFVIVIASRLLADRPDGTERRPGPAAWVLTVGLCGWLAIGSLSVYPHYLAYFNEIGGGPEGGPDWLSDSNLDWGQDLPGLARWVEEHGVGPIWLSYSGTIDPTAYGITMIGGKQFSSVDRPKEGDPVRSRRFALKIDQQPKEGFVAVSLTNLQGVYFRDKKAFAWLTDDPSLEPVAKIGYSIYVYHLSGTE